MVANQSVESELKRILGSQTFRRASRMRDLLDYVVKGALEGVPGTEAGAARDVFGKGDDFDASLDPAVRIQYGRLRKKLAEYYTHEGMGSEIVIEVPSRKYGPVFRWAEHLNGAHSHGPEEPVTPAKATALTAAHDQQTKAAAAGESQATSQVIAVLPFSNLTSDPSQDTFCYGLTEEIITGLASESGVDVIASNSAFQFKDQSVDVRDAGEQLGVQMILEGTVRMEEQQTRITAKLARVNDGVAIWSDTFDTRLDGALDTQHAVARKIIDSLPF